MSGAVNDMFNAVASLFSSQVAVTTPALSVTIGVQCIMMQPVAIGEARDVRDWSSNGRGTRGGGVGASKAG